MQNKKKLPADATPDVHEFHTPPQDIREIINEWGTYNIQATADTENLFPLIAPALPTKWKNRRITKEEMKKGGK